jgi:hypothetical protein
MGHPGQPTSQILAPHDGWSSAFKGPFNTGDGLSCDAFTGADGERRMLLGRPSPCSPAGSQRLDSRSVSVWTTVCPVPPIPAPVWHRSQLGGCAWASGRSASNPVNPRQTAATQRAPQHPCDRFRQACHCERPHEALCDHRHGLLVVFQQHASDRWPALRGECHARSPRLNSSIVP